MDPKDFKFNDDAFDDVFSDAPEHGDGMEDVYSDSKADSQRSFESEFDDIFSGKKEFEFYEMTGSAPREYTEDYYEENDDDGEFRSVATRQQTADSEQPYSYNYNKAAANKAKRVSREREFDSIEDDVYSGRQPREKQKKKASGSKVFLCLILVFALIVGALSVAGYAYVKSLTERVDYKPLETNQYIPASKLMRKEGVRNILLVGVDAREGEENDQTRSDTMMLLTIDDNNNQIKLTSFLRDTYINIPDYAWAKLNAAQARGGIQLLVDTLEFNYGVNIDSYVLVNFSMFTTIIDSIGGIDVEITDKEADYINSKDHMTPDEEKAFPEEISGGMNHFDGAQALWYARIRYLDSDFMRTQRQRKVISAIISKAKKANIKTLMETADRIVSMVETDIDSDGLMNLGLNALKYLKYDLVQQQIPADGTWKNATKNKQAVLEIDFEKNTEILKKFVFEKAETKNKE